MASKKPTVCERIDILETKVDKRPTIYVTIGLLASTVAIIVTLFTFITGNMLKNQGDAIAAKTQVQVVEAIQAHETREQLAWQDRKEGVIQAVLARIFNKEKEKE